MITLSYYKERFSIKEQVHFTKRLAFLIGSGMPLLDSVVLLKKQARSKTKESIYTSIVSSITNGQSLSVSLTPFRHSFGDFAISMIKVGEMSGLLQVNLEYVSGELKKKHMLQQKIKGALLYPAFITFATIGISGLLTMYIFPKILPLFKNINLKLPLSTRFLIFVSESLRSFWLHLLLFVVGASVFAIIVYKKYPTTRYRCEKVLRNIPLVGAMFKNYYIAHVCRVLSLLLKSGLPIHSAVVVTAEATHSLHYKEALTVMSETVLRGEKMSHYMEQRRELFPDLVVHMTAIGESTGNLSETLLYLSGLHEAEVEESAKNISVSVEPLLMLFMGLIVGFIAVSVITPIYQITQNLHG